MPDSNAIADNLGVITDNVTLRNLYSDMLGRLRPDICCDIGAHDGQASLMAKKAAPVAQVYAFEANPEIHQLHRARLENEGVHYLNLAIVDRVGEVTVYVPRTLSKMWDNGSIVDALVTEPVESGKTSLLRRNETATYAEFNVRAQSLDQFFAAAENVTVHESRFALWIDVEGAAAIALRGAEAVLKTTALVLVEVEGHPFWREQVTVEGVRQFLTERGFVALARDQEHGEAQFNVLFVHADYLQAIEDLVPQAHSYPSSDVPVFVPVFNNPTHLRRMISQLRAVGLGNIVVIDNGSQFPSLVNYLHSIENRITVVRQGQNRGPRHMFQDAAFYEQLPQHFCITDPDLEFNPELPANFLEHLIELTAKHRVGKAGFSLDISDPEKMIAEPFQIGERCYRIWEWEAQFWQTRLKDEGPDPAYRALIDTTFAVYNKASFRPENFLDAIRVAGRFTARHLPWYADHRLPPDEAAFYQATSRHSFYTGMPPAF